MFLLTDLPIVRLNNMNDVMRKCTSSRVAEYKYLYLLHGVRRAAVHYLLVLLVKICILLAPFLD
jgi:hypothetical protein